MADDVDLWPIRLDAADSDMVGHWRLLSADERRRAKGYLDAAARRRFVVRRSAVRRVLGAYCGIEPAKLRIQTGRWCKPFVSIPGRSIEFGMASSGENAVIAMATQPVGVDFEAGDVAGLAGIDRYLAAIEIDWLKGQADRGTALRQLWACKEAYVKLTGSGLRQRLDEFAIAFEGRAFTAYEGEATRAHGQMFEYARGTAAVATRDGVADVRWVADYAALEAGVFDGLVCASG
jgi:4'-phosphopantetheinyl transferase